MIVGCAADDILNQIIVDRYGWGCPTLRKTLMRTYLFMMPIISLFLPIPICVPTASGFDDHGWRELSGRLTESDIEMHTIGVKSSVWLKLIISAYQLRPGREALNSALIPGSIAPHLSHFNPTSLRHGQITVWADQSNSVNANNHNWITVSLSRISIIQVVVMVLTEL